MPGRFPDPASAVTSRRCDGLLSASSGPRTGIPAVELGLTSSRRPPSGPTSDPSFAFAARRVWRRRDCRTPSPLAVAALVTRTRQRRPASGRRDVSFARSASSSLALGGELVAQLLHLGEHRRCIGVHLLHRLARLGEIRRADMPVGTAAGPASAAELRQASAAATGGPALRRPARRSPESAWTSMSSVITIGSPLPTPTSIRPCGPQPSVISASSAFTP
jgi:hypothetical protein